MKEFSNKINVKNKKLFSQMYEKRVMCYLRRDLYEHIIQNDEKNYFEIDAFNKKYFNNKELTQNLLNTAIKELEKLGWKCKLSFGGTGLFIYSTENPPVTCWEDGLS